MRVGLVVPGAALAVAGLWSVADAAWQLTHLSRIWERAGLARATGRSWVDLGWRRRRRQWKGTQLVAGCAFLGTGGYLLVAGLG